MKRLFRWQGLVAPAAMVLGLMVAGAPAQASTVNVSFTDNAPASGYTAQNQLAFGADWYAGTATASEFPIFGPPLIKVTQSAKGLGVQGILDARPTEIDGRGLGEFLELEFNAPVQLDSVRFTNVDENGSDGVRIYILTDSGIDLLFRQLSSPNGEATVDLTGGAKPVVGTKFVFAPWGAGKGPWYQPDRNADFSLGGIAVSSLTPPPVDPPQPSVTPVPTPAAAWGGLALLGGLAFRRIRQMRRA